MKLGHISSGGSMRSNSLGIMSAKSLELNPVYSSKRALAASTCFWNRQRTPRNGVFYSNLLLIITCAAKPVSYHSKTFSMI